MAVQPNAWKILNAVCALEDASLTHYEIAVMLLLAKYADPGGVNIHPKQRTIAYVLRVSLITVTRAISGLRRKGYLQVEYQALGMVTHYRFDLEKLGLAVDQAEEKPQEAPPAPAPTNGKRPAAHAPTDDELRIGNFKWQVFQYYSAMERKNFANQQELENYQEARQQLMYLGISELELRREYEAKKEVKV